MDEETRILLLQGIFFQKVETLKVVHAAEADGGTHVGVVKLDYSAMFMGAMHWNSMGEYTGNIADVIGFAVLTDISISLDEIRFTKTYAHRDDPIHYVLHPTTDADIWTGMYQGVWVGVGLVNCSIREVPPSFFEPKG